MSSIDFSTFGGFFYIFRYSVEERIVLFVFLIVLSFMTLFIYNTLSRTKERFKPLRQDCVKVYSCGPTPYNYAHIGNFRTYLFEDMVIRVLRFLGWKVETVMNITDIDDKTIRESQLSGMNLKDFTQKYTKEFLEDMDRLGIERANVIAPISGLITDMQEMIQGLLDKDYAYITEDGNIYYHVEKFKTYGQLAHLDMTGIISDVRIQNDEYKEQVADFALWKAYNPETEGENKWTLTLKDPKTQEEISLIGRPGWHIECSACSYHFLGEQIDIHMGGIDNLFPHHQNEVAQTEAFTGKPFSRYWIHGGHLLVDNKKMSKSLGNYFTLKDIIKKTNHSEILVCRGFRLMSFQNRYRENFNFTFERLESAIQTIRGMDEVIKRLSLYHAPETCTHTIDRNFRNTLQEMTQEFIAFLEDDFATPEALTIVFEFHSFIHSNIDKQTLSEAEKGAIISLLITWNDVLNLYDFALLEEKNPIPEEICLLAQARKEAKDQKDFERADILRNKIQEKGWQMIDEKDGQWRCEPRI